MDNKGFTFVIRSKGKNVVFRESSIMRLAKSFPQSDVKVFDSFTCKPLGTMKAKVVVEKFC